MFAQMWLLMECLSLAVGEELDTEYPRNKDPKKRYEPPSGKELGERFREFETFCWEFLQAIKYPDNWCVCVSSFTLLEILSRIDKREAYYYYFHTNSQNDEGIEINERKLGGLFAYWILKFRPISVSFDEVGDLAVPKEQHDYASNINEYFAAYALYSWLNLWYEATTGQPLDLGSATSSRFHDAVLYAFRYRNINIDSMMLLVESIVTETFTRQDVEVY